VTELLQNASDDQVALAICCGAFLVSGLVMYFSIHVGRLTGSLPNEGDETKRVGLQTQVRHQMAIHETAVRDRAA
jgi:hypothetical protein